MTYCQQSVLRISSWGCTAISQVRIPGLAGQYANGSRRTTFTFSLSSCTYTIITSNILKTDTECSVRYKVVFEFFLDKLNKFIGVRQWRRLRRIWLCCVCVCVCGWVWEYTVTRVCMLDETIALATLATYIYRGATVATDISWLSIVSRVYVRTSCHMSLRICLRTPSTPNNKEIRPYFMT